MTLEPASVALKFGFLAVMYLFLLWVARSAAKDLRGEARPRASASAVGADVTGLHSMRGPGSGDVAQRGPRLVVLRATGHTPGMIYDIEHGAVLGRGDAAEIRLEDPFASSQHARLSAQGAVMVIEDLRSTNGTYLNEELLQGPQPLHPGDSVRIGDSEFSYEEG